MLVKFTLWPTPLFAHLAPRLSFLFVASHTAFTKFGLATEQTSTSMSSSSSSSSSGATGLTALAAAASSSTTTIGCSEVLADVLLLVYQIEPTLGHSELVLLF